MIILCSIIVSCVLLLTVLTNSMLRDYVMSTIFVNERAWT